MFWRKHCQLGLQGIEAIKQEKDFWTQTFITGKQAEKATQLQTQAPFYGKGKRTQKVVPSAENAEPRAVEKKLPESRIEP